MTRRLEGVIFDWAGTTVDYGCFAPVNVFIDIFKMRDIHVSLEEAREPMGLLKIDHIKAMLSMGRIEKLFEEKFGRKWTQQDVEEMYADFEEQLFATLEDYTTPVPGAVELMERLRERGVKIGSTTGYTREMAAIVGEGARAKGYEPDHRITASEVPKGRPHPYMIFDNMMKLDLSDRSTVVKVGDTLSDIREGVNAGVWSVGVLKGGSDLGLTQDEVERMNRRELKERMDAVTLRMKEAGAHYVIEEIGRLDEVLDDIQRRLDGGETL